MMTSKTFAEDDQQGGRQDDGDQEESNSRDEVQEGDDTVPLLFYMLLNLCYGPYKAMHPIMYQKSAILALLTVLP
jgi:hypothetical protein